jgi:hypothetical protein
VYIASIDGPASIELGVPILPFDISPRETLHLVAEDFDRDGLTDLIFGDGRRVHLFRSKPDGEEIQ